MFSKYFILFLLFLSFLNATPSFINGDFEDGTEGEPTGWHDGPAWQGSYPPITGYHGSHYVFINGPYILYQTVDNLNPNIEYTIKFLAAVNINGWNGQYVDVNGIKVYPKNIINLNGFKEYSVKLPLGTKSVTVKAYGGDTTSYFLKIDYFRIISTPSYCEAKKLPEGFNIVDPDGGDNKNSFEIFCYRDKSNKMHDLIALPIKNNSNNFVFENNSTSINYYDTVKNPRKHFHAIEVAVNYTKYNGTLDNGTPKPYFPVITGEQREPIEIVTNGKKYHLMRSTFSNINLIATPYEIDWSSSDIDECDSDKLRKALNQAVKYNTLTQDNRSICHINNMMLSLQNEYRYLTYVGSEVLKKSCKEMAEYVPNNVGVLDDETIAGYFNIDPFEKGRGGLDIGEKGRPITVWCKYQQDLGWVWTFLTALDAKVTNSKNDLIAKQDTCSELGLYFFVPNSKKTFDRVRKYLKNHKSGNSGWENYTGTVREKYKAYTNDPNKEYYLKELGYELIWPYGPLGIYYPCKGNYDATNSCTYKRWYPGKTYVKGWMSGSPMHNIKTLSNYQDSMGYKGWVSILGEQDLNKTNDWWVSDIGAGEEFGPANSDTYSYSPHGVHIKTSRSWPYYEPNGNYTKYAWLNFIHDSEGWIYHNDDNRDFYAYYDYLCMSETNYDTTSRYALVPGFFNAIEHSTTADNTPPNFSDYQVRTKIVNRDINLDVILYKYDPNTGQIDTSKLETNEKKSVGVFLSTFDSDGKLKLIKYLAELKDFDTNNGRITLPSFKLNNATKETYLHFYYCNPAGMDWKECWNFNGSIDYPIVYRKSDLAGESDSYDKFAVRPKNFEINLNLPKNSKGEYYTIAGDSFDINFKANDETNNPTLNYNESLKDSNNSYILSYTESKASLGCDRGFFTPNIEDSWGFTNGESSVNTYYDEVGQIKVSLKENTGYEFASVDSDDTDIKNRLIEQSSVVVNFIPDHFKVDASLSNFNNEAFTYISNNLDMSARVDLNVTAESSLNKITKNYNSNCYAKSTKIKANISYEPSTFSPYSLDNTLYNLYYDNDKIVIDDTNGSLNNLDIQNIATDIFSNTTEGKAYITININFPRKFNEAINPFDMNISNIDITDIDGVTGNSNDIGEARFYYAKVKSSSDLYDDVIDNNISTPIEIRLFCNKSLQECQEYGIDTTKGMTNEYDWWLSLEHNTTANQGKAKLITDNAESTIKPDIIEEFKEGIDKDVTVSYNSGAIRPVTVKVKPTVDMINNNPWILYNKTQNMPPRYIYRVRFVNAPAAWSGEGKTGHTINVNSSGKKSKKVDW